MADSESLPKTEESDEPIIDNFDLIFLCILGAAALLYLYWDTLFGKKEPTASKQAPPPTTLPPKQIRPPKNKDFIKKMRDTVCLTFSSIQLNSKNNQ